MASLRFMSSKRDSIKVMKMKSNGARETPRFLFQAFLLKRRRRRGGKNQRNQNDSESKKEGMKLNIGVECGDSRIKLNSEWSPIPKIVFRTFQPRISYAYVQHSSRYFRISPSKKRCDTLLAEILRCRDSSISRSLFFFFFFFFYTFRNRSCRIEFQRWNIFIPRRESRNLILNREQAAWKKT